MTERWRAYFGFSRAALLASLLIGQADRVMACGMSALTPLTGWKFELDSALLLGGFGLLCQFLFMGSLVLGRKLAYSAVTVPGSSRTSAWLLFVPNTLIWLVFGGVYLFLIVPVVLIETFSGMLFWENVTLVILLPMIYFHSRTVIETFRLLFASAPQTGSDATMAAPLTFALPSRQVVFKTIVGTCIGLIIIMFFALASGNLPQAILDQQIARVMVHTLLWPKSIETPDAFTRMADSGYRPLHLAVLSRFEPAMTWLIQRGADVNARSSAVSHANTPLHLEAKEGDGSFVSTLVKAGASLTATNHYGLTPVQIAVGRWNADTAKAFQQAGADLRAIDERGNTLLHSAMLNYQVGSDTLDLLIDTIGLDMHARNASGETALDLAIRHRFPAVVSYLVLQKKADFSRGTMGAINALSIANPSDDAALIDHVLSQPVDTHAREHLWNRTFLHLAVIVGSLEHLQRVLAANPDLNATDSEGNTPLHLAVFLPPRDRSAAVVQALLEKGADTTIANNHGKTPLQMAEDQNLTNIADLLRTPRR